MKKSNLLFSLCLFLMAMKLGAQNPITGFDKMDSQLKLWLAEPQELINQQPNLFKNGPVANPFIPIIFKSHSSNVAAIITKHRGQIHSVIGKIYTAVIPLSEILSFASENEIVKVESSQRMKVCNDKGRKLIGADRVNAGDLPGGIPYTGKGVIVGVYDFGFDFIHPDFRKKNDSTQTRFLSIWDQTSSSGTSPLNFNYGSEWNQSQINAALTNPGIVSEADNDGHGTHVTGTAAGLRGIAYDADIIAVKASASLTSDSTYYQDSKALLDGINYIYQKATTLGKPCVVNISVGYNIGTPHDGSGLIEQGLDYLVNSRKGFMICVAAGNENYNSLHFGGFNLTKDSIWTYARGINGGMTYVVFNSVNDDSTFISMSADSASIKFTNGTISGQKKIFQSPWLKIKDIKNSAGGYNYT
ncbi:MAG: S8 family serine peptidase, partial [Bacteroidia bacterium]